MRRADALLLLGAYLLGCIPFGALFARRAGVDVRRAGSGNIGATNVARTAGAGLGIATLIADAAKGALPVVLAARIGGDGLAAAAGVAAFLGHVFPAPLGFRGGKGVATALGALAVLAPVGLVPAIAAFVLVLAATRWVSLASMVAALAAPPAVALSGAPRATVAASAAMAIVIVGRHRDNLRRLRAGTEPRLGVHKKQAPPAE